MKIDYRKIRHLVRLPLVSGPIWTITHHFHQFNWAFEHLVTPAAITVILTALHSEITRDVNRQIVDGDGVHSSSWEADTTLVFWAVASVLDVIDDQGMDGQTDSSGKLIRSLRSDKCKLCLVAHVFGFWKWSSGNKSPASQNKRVCIGYLFLRISIDRVYNNMIYIRQYDFCGVTFLMAFLRPNLSRSWVGIPTPSSRLFNCTTQYSIWNAWIVQNNRLKLSPPHLPPILCWRPPTLSR